MYIAYVTGGIGPVLVDSLDPLFQCQGMLDFVYDTETGKEVIFDFDGVVRFKEFKPTKWYKLKNGLSVLESRLVFTQEFQDFTADYKNVLVDDWFKIKQDFIEKWVIEEYP